MQSEQLERKNRELGLEVRELREECLLANNKLLVLERETNEKSMRKEDSYLLENS